VGRELTGVPQRADCFDGRGRIASPAVRFADHRASAIDPVRVGVRASDDEFDPLVGGASRDPESAFYPFRGTGSRRSHVFRRGLRHPSKFVDDPVGDHGRVAAGCRTGRGRRRWLTDIKQRIDHVNRRPSIAPTPSGRCAGDHTASRHGAVY
jgi:hypothetical protein